jgi:hypothetical protein
MYDEPTRDELDAEAFERETHIQNHEWLCEGDEWYARANAILGELTTDHGRWIQELCDRLKAECVRRFDEAMPHTLEAMQDAMEYNQDVYKYYGVSRRDFM